MLSALAIEPSPAGRNLRAVTGCRPPARIILDTAPLVRAAVPQDLAPLLDLETSCFPGDRLSPRSMRRLLADHPDQILVAEDQSQPIAALFMLLNRGHGVARIYSLAVAPTARRRGLGRCLLRAAAVRAGGLGKHCLRLEVREDNDAAIAFYTRQGFQPIGRRETYYEDGMAALRLQRPVSAPPSVVRTR